MVQKEVYWSPIAIESYLDIKDYIDSIWDSKIVEEFENLVDERVEQLKQNNLIAPKIENTNYRKLVIHKNTSLIYDITEELIRIHLVWDNRQDPKELKKYLR